MTAASPPGSAQRQPTPLTQVAGAHVDGGSVHVEAPAGQKEPPRTPGGSFCASVIPRRELNVTTPHVAALREIGGRNAKAPPTAVGGAFDVHGTGRRPKS